MDMELIVWGVGIGVAALLGAFLMLKSIQAFRLICPPNQIIIISGKKRKLESGREVGYEVKQGGGVWRLPILHRIDYMDTRLMPVGVEVRNSYSKGGIPLIVSTIANVKISTDARYVSNVAERFLKKDKRYIAQVAQETLEGHLRGIIATLTPEEVNEDRLKFAQKVREETEDDFHKLGLELDILKIQHVSDEVDYLKNLGREQTANVIRNAEIAESNCQNEAAQQAAEYDAQGRVALENAQRTIQQRRNEQRQIMAELDAQAESEEKRADAASEQARAESEQALQKIRSQLEQKRLDADVVIPAQVEKVAAELLAQGEASTIAEQGKAQAAALSALGQTWASAGSAAGEIFLLRQLEEVLQPILDNVKKVRVERTAVVDRGDGKAIAAFMAAYPQAVLEILGRLGQATGMDLAAMTSGTPEPRGEVS